MGNTLFLEWNPSVLKSKYDGHSYSESFNGLSLGYSRAFQITESTPLFVEPGIAAQYSFWKEDGVDFEDDYYYYEVEDTKLQVMSLKVPVNVIYRFDLQNSSIALMPFAGITLRGNLWGQAKAGKEKADIFSKDDMGSKDATAKRFQVGWQVGFKAKFGPKFIVGGSYGTDFNDFMYKTKIQTATVMVGLIL